VTEKFAADIFNNAGVLSPATTAEKQQELAGACWPTTRIFMGALFDADPDLSRAWAKQCQQTNFSCDAFASQQLPEPLPSHPKAACPFKAADITPEELQPVKTSVAQACGEWLPD